MVDIDITDPYREMNERALARTRAMSPDELMAVLRRLGIYDERGNLTPRYGNPYRQAEIDELFLVAQRPDALNEHTLESFAGRFGRSPQAIALVIRSCQAAEPANGDGDGDEVREQVVVARAKHARGELG